MDEDYEEYLKQFKKNDLNVEDELNQLTSEIALEKSKEKKKKSGDDLNLSDLENEIDDEENGEGGKNEDDDLAALEKEGLEEEEEKEDKKEKEESKDKIEGKDVEKKEENAVEKDEEKIKENEEENEEEDSIPKYEIKITLDTIKCYSKYIEEKYCALEKMRSLNCIAYEISLYRKIIEILKKNNDENLMNYKTKNGLAKMRFNNILNMIENGVTNLQQYKISIKSQLSWDSNLIQRISKDKNIKDNEIDALTQRINKRISIIKEELAQNVEEEEPKEEIGEEAAQENQQNDQNNQNSNEQNNEKESKEEPAENTTKFDMTVTMDKIKCYSPYIESKYNSLEKMESLGVLSNEVELYKKIIEVKKENNDENIEGYEGKINMAEIRMNSIQNKIEAGLIDFETYKKRITKQMEWDKKLLEFLKQDKKILPEQVAPLTERINKRLEIIKSELEQQIEEEQEEEEEKNDEGKKEENNEVKKEENNVKASENTIKNEEKKEENNVKINENTIKQEEKNKSNIETNDKQEMIKTEVKKEKDKPVDKETERVMKIVENLLADYRKAIEYFKVNDMPDQVKKAVKIAKEICESLMKIKNGKWDPEDEFSLPNPINPEFIYGYSEKERKEKFLKVIQEYMKQKDDLIKQINKTKEMCSKNKAYFKKNKATITSTCNAKKEKIDQINKVLDHIKLKYQDKWSPAPSYIIEEEEEQVEKINEKMNPNELQVFVGTTDYLKDIKLYIVFRLEEGELLKESLIESKSKGNFSRIFTWKFTDAEFKNLYRNKIMAIIYEKKWYQFGKEKIKGTFEINLSALKSQSKVEQKITIELSSKRFEPTIEIILCTRCPCKDKEYTTKTKEVLKISKIYASFKEDIRPPLERNQNQNTITSKDLTSTVIKKPKQVSKTNDTIKNQNPVSQKTQIKQVAPIKGEKIDPSEFDPNELEDFDNVNYINSIAVLDSLFNELDEKIKKIDGRTPRQMIQQKSKLKIKKDFLSEQLGGEISPDEYMAILKPQFDKAKKMSMYFAQNGQKEKSKKLSDRMQILFKEMKGLAEFMKGNN